MKLGKLRRRAGGGGVFDRRAQGPTGGSGLGLPALPIGKGGMGIGGLVIILLLVFVLPRCLGSDMGGLGGALDPFGGAGGAPVTGSETEVNPDDPTAEFANLVFEDIQYTWDEIFERAGVTYEDTSLVLFRGSTTSGCGPASSATGPFYCPADGLVYIDLSFFKELENRFGAGGDFAQAYVLAHEVGHHVQNLLGTNAEVQRMAREDPDLKNDLSVRLELQADCFAGVWGRSAQAAGILQPGDVEEGMTAAEAIGDDRISEMSGGRISPEDYTHGTSEQRAEWLRTGIQVGNPDACDTFSNDI
ncbi:MAG TPA: neutral zinc metallopeptidase [Actinomycetota bacterium]